MQNTDGNLVLYHQGQALWASGAAGAGAALYMQTDGNLVIYNSGVAKWDSQTAGFPGGLLQLQNDSNLVIYAGGHPIWDRGRGYLGNQLDPGWTLGPGAYLLSPDGQYELAMQATDGNLVLYHQGQALWSSGPAGAGATVTMQTDGNFVVYNGGVAKWNSSTDGFPGANLVLQEDSNVVIYHAGHPVWDRMSGYLGNELNGWTLNPGSFLLSPDHRYELIMQPADGNLVLYQAGTALWSSGATGAGSWAVMQSDGNFVIYNGGVAKWNSQTAGHPGAVLLLQDDANLVIYQGSTPLWDRLSGILGAPANGGNQGQAIVNAAASQAGKPYCWGGGNWYGPTIGGGCGGAIGFDCTGLTMYAVYQATGIKLGRFDQESRGTPVARANLQPGDLVFFGPPSGGAPYSHAAVYAGNNRIWDAADYGEPVALHYMYSNYDGAERYWH